MFRLTFGILIPFCGVFFVLAGPMPAAASGLFEDTKKLIAELGCGECHSTDGSILVSGVPRIAGQKYTYLYRQLRHFRRGTVSYKGEVVASRRHAVMNDMATRLFNGQLKKVAEFYASRPCGQVSAPSAARPPGVERCETCHGGERTNPWHDTPYLGAQDETYLKRSIKRLWESRLSPADSGSRYHRLAEVMFVDADEPHLDAFAAYYAGLPCRDPVRVLK